MIVVECKNDELLMKRMGFPRKEIHHAGNKGNVFNKVKKLKKAIGLIDEDPNSEQPGEYKKYKLMQKEGGIKLLENIHDKDKCVVQVSPYLEHWLLDRAKKCNVHPGKYSLPDDPKDLHRLTRLDKNRNFIDFLDTFINSDKELAVMREWIIKAL